MVPTRYGTLALLGFVFLAIAFASGQSPITFKNILIFSPLVLLSVFAFFHFSIVPDYVKDRIGVSVRLISGTLSEEDRRGVGFQTLQNLEQVQEGGLLGTGFTEIYL